MSSLSQRFKTHRFITLAMSVALFGILAGVVFAWSSRAKSQKPNAPNAASATSAVRVVSAELSSLGSQTVLAIKLQNTSGKDIKAYTIASGSTWVTTSYFLDEKSFAAGATVNRFVPLSSEASQNSIGQLSGKEFTVVAVYFSDDTGDGVVRYVSALVDQHAGIRDQAKRILPCLTATSFTLGNDLGVAGCEADALKLPVKMIGRSADYEDGLENARRELLSKIDDIKEKARMSRFNEAAEKRQQLTKVFKWLAESPE